MYNVVFCCPTFYSYSFLGYFSSDPWVAMGAPSDLFRLCPFVPDVVDEVAEELPRDGFTSCIWTGTDTG